MTNRGRPPRTGEPDAILRERGRRFAQWLRGGMMPPHVPIELTAQDVAKLTGLSPSIVGYYLRDGYDPNEGRMRLPKDETIRLLAEKLRLDYQEGYAARHWLPGGPAVIRESVPNYATAPNTVRTFPQGLPEDVIDKLREWLHALPSENVRIPLVGRIAAGTPVLAEQNIEDYLFITQDLLKGHRADSCFAVRVSGRSMEGSLIGDGDILIVLQQEDAEDGQIVAAYVEGQGITVKRLRKRRNVALLESDWIDGKRDQVPLNGGRILGRVIAQRREYL